MAAKENRRQRADTVRVQYQSTWVRKINATRAMTTYLRAYKLQ
jgi:hypothetical protein